MAGANCDRARRRPGSPLGWRVLPLLALIATTGAQVYGAPDSKNASPSPPVVVELFTSEGCSDCPPADDLLNAMAQHPPADLNIIPLAFHVTYWDSYGWRDRFSDAQYTERQKSYQLDFHLRSIYTPESVIDGHYEAVGNDSAKVFALIRQAASDPKPVTVEVSAGDRAVNVTVHASSGTAAGQVELAITEDGLSTAVKAGENNSRTLQHNAVVRSLQNLGSLKDGSFSRTVGLRLKRDWQRDKLHAVVIVQDAAGQVLGAATAPLAVQQAAGAR